LENYLSAGSQLIPSNHESSGGNEKEKEGNEEGGTKSNACRNCLGKKKLGMKREALAQKNHLSKSKEK